MAKRAVSEVDKQRQARREASARSFARRHPRRAAQERALKKANRAARKAYDHKIEGTPETHDKASRVRQGALARLFQSGALSADELAWSQEIAVVARRIVGDVRIGTVGLETRVDVSRDSDAAFFEALGQVRAEVAYSAWRAELARPGVVLAIIVEDIGIEAAARRYGMGRRRVRAMLLAALDAWPGHCRDARDAIEAADLAAAHAGLL